MSAMKKLTDDVKVREEEEARGGIMQRRNNPLVSNRLFNYLLLAVLIACSLRNWAQGKCAIDIISTEALDVS